ncbi:MAG: signal recognition particle protein, partial [Dongiaceae bacterium]
MFDGLTKKFTGVFDALRRRGKLSTDDVREALRDIRRALLEADVALPVLKDFLAKVETQALQEEVLKNVRGGDQVVKIVHDELVAMLGESAPLNLNVTPPAVIMMAGLQGSGKTTSAAKLAKRLQDKARKKVLLASLDIYRPAAQEQLEILAKQIGGMSLPIVAGEKPLAIAERALREGKNGHFDVVILDTAGRLQIDAELMAELIAIRDFAKPAEILLVADAMTGQEAVNIAKGFHEQVGVSGIILTRLDGDARGGAALSMRAVTGQPIKFIGVGEKIDQLEEFHGERLASRILDMGDVVSLVEKAIENIDQLEAEKSAARFAKNELDLNDLLAQMRNMQKLGGLGGMMNLLPGMGRMKEQLNKVDDSALKKQEAIILSMTPLERKNPDLIKASRKQRIANGSGTRVEDINKLLKNFMEAKKMMKQMNKMGGMEKMAQMFGG